MVETVQLGHSDIEVAPLDIGAMSWANRSLLGYGGADSPREEQRAVKASWRAPTRSS
jgi:aryl-alcohol dehydrogenase-like predicted oxidoreductase